MKKNTQILKYREERGNLCPENPSEFLGGNYEIVLWSAINPNKSGSEGSISASLPESGGAAQVNVNATSEEVQDIIRGLKASGKSKALQHFGLLYQNNEPTDNLYDICHVVESHGDIPERLAKKIAEATATLDFPWLEGYAEAVKLLSKELDSLTDPNAMGELRATSKVDWEKRQKMGISALLWPQLFAPLARRKPLCVVETTLGGVKTKVFHNDSPEPNYVTRDDIIEIIKFLTEQLIDRGEIRPPCKAEVLAKINALLNRRAGLKSGAEKKKWESSRLNDSLKSLGFYWLPSSRDIKKV